MMARGDSEDSVLEALEECDLNEEELTMLCTDLARENELMRQILVAYGFDVRILNTTGDACL